MRTPTIRGEWRKALVLILLSSAFALPGTAQTFPQSVASGDPRPTSVVLWTRLVDGDTATDRTVSLNIVSDAGTLQDVGTSSVLGGTNVWSGGALTAESAHDGVVKVKVTDLTEDTTY